MKYRKLAVKYVSKYPKFLLLLITLLIAYLIFYGKSYDPFHDFISSFGYVGTFFAGALFTYGFTAAPATAILLILAKEQHIFLAAFVGGAGALLSDLIIFRFIRHSFADEILKLSKENVIRSLNKFTPSLIKRYLLPVLAGFIIASPLPDEIGVSLFAASKSISMKIFSVISYALNTTGIFIILVIGRGL